MIAALHCTAGLHRLHCELSPRAHAEPRRAVPAHAIRGPHLGLSGRRPRRRDRGRAADPPGHQDARHAHAPVRTIGTGSRTGTDTVRSKGHAQGGFVDDVGREAGRETDAVCAW